MSDNLAQIQIVLARTQRLAAALRADPDGHVRRSANELLVAFAVRAPMEPAVARIRDGVEMLRRGNQDGSRREFQRRAAGLDRLEKLIEQELVPNMRRVGFDV
jgi:hypothetical protein